MELGQARRQGFRGQGAFSFCRHYKLVPSDVADVPQQQSELHGKNVLSLEVCVIELHGAQDLIKGGQNLFSAASFKFRPEKRHQQPRTRQNRRTFRTTGKQSSSHFEFLREVRTLYKHRCTFSCKAPFKIAALCIRLFSKSVLLREADVEHGSLQM